MASGICGKQKITKGKLKDARSLRKKMTRVESILWEYLRDRRCGGLKFRRQQIIKGFITDFYCEQTQIAVELDGGVHDDEDAKAEDARREKVFKTRGIKTIRFKNEDVEAGAESVTGKIAELCRLNLKSSKLTQWESKRLKTSVTPLSGEGPGVRSKRL
jgi:very-short-patch-repair endonuclease